MTVFAPQICDCEIVHLHSLWVHFPEHSQKVLLRKFNKAFLETEKGGVLEWS
jgi:hypothetical protein